MRKNRRPIGVVLRGEWYQRHLHKCAALLRAGQDVAVADEPDGFASGSSSLCLLGWASRPPITRSPPHQTRPEASCFGYGSRTSMPVRATSFKLRVTRVRSCTRAVAASNPSTTGKLP